MRRRIALARHPSGRLRRSRSARRPHLGTTRHLLRRRATPITSRSPTRTARWSRATRSRRGHVSACACTRAAPSSSSRARGSRPRAESRWFRAEGWHVVNMTQYPEAYLARELGMHYAASRRSPTTTPASSTTSESRPCPRKRCSRSSKANVDRVRALLARSRTGVARPNRPAADARRRSALSRADPGAAE